MRICDNFLISKKQPFLVRKKVSLQTCLKIMICILKAKNQTSLNFFSSYQNFLPPLFFIRLILCKTPLLKVNLLLLKNKIKSHWEGLWYPWVRPTTPALENVELIAHPTQNFESSKCCEGKQEKIIIHLNLEK